MRNSPQNLGRWSRALAGSSRAVIADLAQVGEEGAVRVGSCYSALVVAGAPLAAGVDGLLGDRLHLDERRALPWKVDHNSITTPDTQTDTSQTQYSHFRSKTKINHNNKKLKKT